MINHMSKILSRNIEATIREHSEYLPVIAIVGPRQSGKSTLVSKTFQDYKYYNLEDEATYQRALTDPSGFIKACPYKTIIDEAQLVPRVFNAIQISIDKEQKPGHFILTGSHNFLLMKSISQNFAGRVSVITLLPLAFDEIYKDNSSKQADSLINSTIVKGSYPRVYSTSVPQEIFYRNYIKTYISRDVEGFLDVRNIRAFNKFLTLLARDVGGIVNISRYAKDLQVNVRTISRWLSILEAGYIVYLMPAYSTNSRKQIVKTPKIYFIDTGLVCYLNKIKTESDLIAHKIYGKIYENFIISECIKKYTNKAEDFDFSFYRDKSKKEIDLIDNSSANLVATEIQSTYGYRASYLDTLIHSNDLLNSKNIEKQLLYRGEESFNCDDIHVISEADWFFK